MDFWKQLAQPFAPEALQWHLESFSAERQQAWAVPIPTPQSLLERLDQALGPEGWEDHYEVLQTSPLVVVKCRLSLHGVAKEDVGQANTFAEAFAHALVKAAAKFGVGRYLQTQGQWIDHNPNAPTPPPKATPPAPTHSTSESSPPAEVASESSPPAEVASENSPPAEAAKPEPHELIDRLIERLKAQGHGKEVAKIVMKYQGYGQTLDETRRLYAELRTMLKGNP